MPEVGQQLLKSFEREDVSLGELADLVAKDQALSAKVLRLANSARYSPSRSVGTVKDAAAALGLRTLRDLTLSACLSGAMPDVPGHDRKQFWRQNVALGSYAVPLARWVGADDDLAYMGGMMLRLGEVLMLMADPQSVSEVIARAKAVDSRLGMESSLLGTNHAQLTAELARRWRFPQALVQAFVAAQEPLAAKPFDRLGAALRLASVITDAREAGQPVADALLATQSELLKHLNLDLAWLDSHLPDHTLACAGADGMAN